MKINTKIITVDEYIKTFPKNVQTILNELREIIKKLAPKAAESISYGMIGYKLNGRPLIYFGAFKNHIGLYPTPTGITAFKKELEPYIHAKGSIQFPLDKPMPFALLKKIIKYRVKENLGK